MTTGTEGAPESKDLGGRVYECVILLSMMQMRVCKFNRRFEVGDLTECLGVYAELRGLVETEYTRFYCSPSQDILDIAPKIH